MIRELSGNEVNEIHYELLVKDIVAAAEKLPPFPDIAWKVTSLIKRDALITEIEEVIKYDQVIAARILRLAQSAYFGRRFEIRSLRDAILLLGSKRLVQVIVAACASRYFERGGTGRDERELWEHSAATAIMSEIICRRLNHKKILTIYTAALLHDIGKTVLNVYAKIYLHSTLRQIRGESRMVKVEQRALGIDHQELGGIIGRNWKFPGEITAAIEHHHDPENAGRFHQMASMVYISNELAGSVVGRKENPGRQPVDPDHDAVFKGLGITRKMAEHLQIDLVKNLDSVKSMLAG